MDEPLVYQLWRQLHRWVAMFGRDNRWRHLSGKPTPRLNLPPAARRDWRHLEDDKVDRKVAPTLCRGIGRRCKSSNGFSRAVLISRESYHVPTNPFLISLLAKGVFQRETFFVPIEHLKNGPSKHPFSWRIFAIFYARWLYPGGNTSSHSEQRS